MVAFEVSDIMRTALWMVVLVGVASCLEPDVRAPPSSAPNDVYVWRRQHSDALRSAMTAVAPHIDRFKVLVREHEGRTRREVWMPFRIEESAGRPTIAVWRIDGTSPLTGLDVQPLLARLGASGVLGVEVDYDCPTQQLPAYLLWLRQQRDLLPTTMSLMVTALPTWATAPNEVARLAHTVDEVTVQVHAIAAPTLFEPHQAARDLQAFVDATKPSDVDRIRVALPTYRVRLTEGTVLSSTVEDIETFKRVLPWPRRSWFRLGATDDHDAWGAPLLSAVLTGKPHDSVAAVLFVATEGDTALLDVVVENTSDVDVVSPTKIVLPVTTIAVDGIRGYRPLTTEMTLVHDMPPRLQPGERRTVGWVRTR
jgi:hypothetical protein